MKKKKLLRFSKRLLILLLCTSLVTGACFNKHKMTANATSVAIGFTTYTLYEICMYLGTLVIAGLGIGIAVDNRDKLAQIGKDFIDSCDISNLSGWALTSAHSSGQSYVYGSEAFQEIKETSFEVIQGGGNSPRNDDDNDGDKTPYELRTEELNKIGMWGTAGFTNWLCEQIEPLLEKINAGEETFLTNYFPEVQYDGKLERDSTGNYITRAVSTCEGEKYKYVISSTTSFKVSAVLDNNTLLFYSNRSSAVTLFGPAFQLYESVNDGWKLLQTSAGSRADFGADSFTANIPIFSSYEACANYLNTGDDSACINKIENYRIADWLQEDWRGVIDALNTGIRSLNGNMLIVGEALNQAMANQMNGLGYIESLLAQIAAMLPLTLPEVVDDPEYFPSVSDEPVIPPQELPWKPIVPDPTPPEPDEPVPDDPDDPKNTFGLSTLFGILILLIMIIIMLLFIFISCLAFIVMIFRIEATTGFLPEEMIAALDYLKTLQIPGFGMSVYAFFMSLIYIILIFTIIGILRKNIDKIKFPRKGG